MANYREKWLYQKPCPAAAGLRPRAGPGPNPHHTCWASEVLVGLPLLLPDPREGRRPAPAPFCEALERAGGSHSQGICTAGCLSPRLTGASAAASCACCGACCSIWVTHSWRGENSMAGGWPPAGRPAQSLGSGLANPNPNPNRPRPGRGRGMRSPGGRCSAGQRCGQCGLAWPAAMVG